MSLNINHLLPLTLTALSLLGCGPGPEPEDQPLPRSTTTYAGTFQVTNPSYTVTGSVLWTQSSDSTTKFGASGDAQVEYTGCASYSGKRLIPSSGGGDLTFIQGGYGWSLSVEPFEVTCNGQPVPINFGPLTPSCAMLSFPGTIEQSMLNGSATCGSLSFTWAFTKGR